MTGHRIDVLGQRFYANHGCLPEEAIIGQEYLVDVRIWVDLTPSAESMTRHHHQPDITATARRPSGVSGQPGSTSILGHHEPFHPLPHRSHHPVWDVLHSHDGLGAGMAQDDCPYDLNGDGVTGANELLFFLSDYGVAGNTDHDFNDNGFRDFEDALMLSRHLGTNCPQTELEDTTGIILGLLIEPVDTLTQDLSDGPDMIPAGAITYRLYAEVSQPQVTVVGVWGNSAFPLTLNAPDGLFFSSFQTSTTSLWPSRHFCFRYPDLRTRIL